MDAGHLLLCIYLVNIEHITANKAHLFLKKHVLLSGDLSTNHIMAIACLGGLFCNREMVRDAYIPLALVNTVRKKVYSDSLEASPMKFRLAAEQAARALGYRQA